MKLADYCYRAALAVALCWSLSTPALARPPTVLVSIAPLHSLAAGVMADVGEPTLLLSGGASPHALSLRPSQRRRLADATVVFWVGPELEPFLDKPLAAGAARSEALLTIAPTQLERRRGGVWADHGHGHGHGHGRDPEHDHDGGRALDPHFWLDPDNAIAVVQRMRDVLSELDAENAARYGENAERLQTRLRALSETVRTQLQPLLTERPAYVVFHDAYQYFEQRFGLQPLGTVTLEPARRPGAARLSELRQSLRARRARCVFSEPQFPPRLLATLVEDSGIRIAELDPLGASLTPGRDHYFQLIQNLAKNLSECLTS